MAVEITRPGKHTLVLECPVMPAAGIVAFGDVYGKLIDLDKLGALVTAPVSLEPRHPAGGTRVIPLDAGVLVHTGLPHPGLIKTLDHYRNVWRAMTIPVILHLLATTPDHGARAARRIDGEDAVHAIELGLDDGVDAQEAAALTRAAVRSAEKPVLVRLPLDGAPWIAEAAVDAGADALVVAAPPRGSARDPHSGRLVGGRIYGPLVKPMALRRVEQLAQDIQDVPIIGAGGIHSPQDARDFIEAGARAVQVDSVTWVRPEMLELIARDLGGYVLTRRADALPDG